MKPNPALSLYERIEAASRLQDLPSQVRDIRVILETLFNLLTREENRSFSNLYGRMEYIFDKMEVRPLIREQLHGLRIFSNKVAHNDMQLTPENGMTCIRAIAEGVEYFYETKVPADLLEIYPLLATAGLPNRNQGGRTDRFPSGDCGESRTGRSNRKQWRLFCRAVPRGITR